MTQNELNRSVAKATGESVSAISRMGFVPLTPQPVEREPEDYIVDWDELEGRRPIAVFDRPVTAAMTCSRTAGVNRFL